MTKRVYWIDLLKILACFLIIINHTGSYLLDYVGVNNKTALFYSINFAICKIGVPLFLMISGYLLLKRESNYKEIFKRIFRIIVPLIILSLVFYLQKYGFNAKAFVKLIPDMLASPVIVSFWYLYMLIGLYLVTPFIQKMIKNFKRNDYRAFTIICLLIPSLIPVISAYTGIEFNSNFMVALIPICVGYYVAGIYVSNIELNKRNRNIAYLLFFLPIILFVLSIYLPFINGGNLDYRLDTYAYITTALPALSLFYLFRYYFENKEFKKTGKIISEISLVTFGIYLFHMFLNYKIYRHIGFIFDLNPYIGIIALELITFIICGIITYILRKIPIVKKFL